MGDDRRFDNPADVENSRTDDASRPDNQGQLGYVHSSNLPDLLRQLKASLWVTTYQVGKLVVLRPRSARLSMLLRSFDRAMGLAFSGNHQVAVGTRSHVWFLEEDSRLLRALDSPSIHDGCFVPRRAHVTGDCRGHEMVWGRDLQSASGSHTTLWVVNTLFSCLCTLNDSYSFVPRWQPPFIDALAPEDRCHLNGIAIRECRPRYMTALGTTNDPAGSRAMKLNGGCVIDLDTGALVCERLCMPHSPRWHRGALWVLNSGRGELLRVDLSHGTTDVVARFAGYPRGLALRDNFAFVGLSQVRETATFGGVPLTNHNNSLKCGISVVELDSGRAIGEVEFTGVVSEIFDLQLLAGICDPAVVGLEKETIHHVFSLPEPSLQQRMPVTAALTETRESEASRRSGCGSAPLSSEVDCQYLGRCRQPNDGWYAADVYYLRYRGQHNQEGLQAAKLFMPVGKPPASGWPLSVWCHGLGDPATQLHRWPFVGTKWRVTRGRLAGRWAHWGVATLTPWMPGDGPSEPLGTYSPFSLQRNGQAVVDAVRALQATLESDRFHIELASREVGSRSAGHRCHVDFERAVLRTSCVASATLVHLAARALEVSEVVCFRAYVADDFQPAIAHNQSFLGPKLDRLPAARAAAMRVVWLRVLWALIARQGLFPQELVSGPACEFFSRPTVTPAGTFAKILRNPWYLLRPVRWPKRLSRRWRSRDNRPDGVKMSCVGCVLRACSRYFNVGRCPPFCRTSSIDSALQVQIPFSQRT